MEYEYGIAVAGPNNKFWPTKLLKEPILLEIRGYKNVNTCFEVVEIS